MIWHFVVFTVRTTVANLSACWQFACVVWRTNKPFVFNTCRSPSIHSVFVPQNGLQIKLRPLRTRNGRPRSGRHPRWQLRVRVPGQDGKALETKWVWTTYLCVKLYLKVVNRSWRPIVSIWGQWENLTFQTIGLTSCLAFNLPTC